MEEIDTNWLDQQPLPVTDSIQQNSELEMLKELANKVGCYSYEYKPEFQQDSGANAEENIGIMAQDLLKIPGLASSVITNEDGSLAVDGNRLALSALGYVAALARHILGVTDNDSNRTVSNELQNSETETGVPTSGAETTGTGSSEVGGFANGSTVQTTDSEQFVPASNTSGAGLNSEVYNG